MDLPLDISNMNLDWVNSTEDKLFKDLEVAQRAMLYMVFYEELSWKMIDYLYSCDVLTAKCRFNQIKIEVAG